jgi:enamine deaminase RidA (YjgF/YER057c/UK114 family)
MLTIEPYSARGVFDPPTYTQAVKVTGGQTFLFLSGQVAYDAQGNPVHRGDVAGQARVVFQAIRAHVEAAGGTLTNVVKLTTFLTDIRHRADILPVREEFFGKKMPPSTLVAVDSLAHPDWLIEVEAIAVL